MILLFRVDERLLHGQVVIGWGSHLRADRYLLVDDELAGSHWEQELYRLSLPDGTSAEFVTATEAVERLPTWREEPVRSVLLTRDLRTMLVLAESGRLEGVTVNLGGIHPAPGRRQVRPYLHLDDEDVARLGRLGQLGVNAAARDLPDSVAMNLERLLRE
jgi:mannose/fructose/N-acetylgalactosamine-specific phosphotransferase system component IIB